MIIPANDNHTNALSAAENRFACDGATSLMMGRRGEGNRVGVDVDEVLMRGS